MTEQCIIKQADMADYPIIRDLYYQITDSLRTSKYSPGWKRDIYPTQEFLIDSIQKGDVYIGSIQNYAVSCMVVNQEGNDGYRKAHWRVDAGEKEIYVIHALGVLPAYSGKGYAKQMVRFVIDSARTNAAKAVRLDVLKGNLPAVKAYSGVGFQYIETISMYYEDTGWTDYELYELDLLKSEVKK